ncbi:MAG: tetratricopeptide repeat protein [Bdellovibrionales bacterium]|nr:tetratricopeptide repeat protein [Bdellovibrionales bacterium]
MKRLLALSLVLLFSLPLSGCLKTRSQLREDDPMAAGIPNQPEPVRDRGGYVVDELKSEITRLTGRIEDMERELKDQQEANEERGKGPDAEDLEKRIVELENAQAAMLEAIRKIEKSAPPPDAGDSFEKAKDAYRSKDYEGAINHLNVYLRNSGAKNAEEATFLRGESYFSLKQYKKAIIDYSKFPEKFNRSRLLPEALWKIGQCFDSLGMREDAQAFYQELVDKFPKSGRTDQARRKLGGGGSKGKR